MFASRAVGRDGQRKLDTEQTSTQSSLPAILFHLYNASPFPSTTQTVLWRHHYLQLLISFLNTKIVYIILCSFITDISKRICIKFILYTKFRIFNIDMLAKNRQELMRNGYLFVEFIYHVNSSIYSIYYKVSRRYVLVAHYIVILVCVLANIIIKLTTNIPISFCLLLLLF